KPLEVLTCRYVAIVFLSYQSEGRAGHNQNNRCAAHLAQEHERIPVHDPSELRSMVAAYRAQFRHRLRPDLERPFAIRLRFPRTFTLSSICIAIDPNAAFADGDLAANAGHRWIF